MNVSSETIARQVLEWKPLLEGAFVNSVQTISENVLKFKFHTREGSKSVVVTSSAFFVSRYSIPVTLERAGFSQFLKKKLYNQRVLSFHQHESDRIVVLEFSDYFLVWEFFAGGNVILCDKEWNVLSAQFKRESQERLVKKGVRYSFPPSVGKPLGLESIAVLPSVNDSLDQDFSQSIQSVEKKPTPLDQSRAKLAHSLKAQLDSLERFSEQVRTSQEKAQWLQSHQGELQQLLQFVQQGQSKGWSESSINQSIDRALSSGWLGGNYRVRFLAKEKKLLVEID